jgi:hypothetical protein
VDLSRLLRFELENHLPAWPIEDFCKEDFYFNADLTKPEFPFLSEDIETLAKWETRTQEQVEMWKAQACAVVRWFPELETYRPGQSAAQVTTAMEKVGAEHDFVRATYETFRRDEFPPAKLLDSHWTLFRHTQIHLLAALRYVRKYGPNTSVISKELHNDLLDIDYLVLATLVGGLASHDRASRDLFRIACPTGQLIPD